MSFKDSYLFPIRQKIGADLLLLPGASCLFIDEDDRLLLERRSDFNIWGIPGGSPEPGEDIVTALRREMLEETGISIDTFIPYGFNSNPRTKTIVYPNGHWCHYFVMLFYAHWPTGAVPVISEESLELCWFKPHALPTEIMPSLPATITAYLQFRKTGIFQII